MDVDGGPVCARARVCVCVCVCEGGRQPIMLAKQADSTARFMIELTSSPFKSSPPVGAAWPAPPPLSAGNTHVVPGASSAT
jgi:hypothetical protein